MKEVWLLWKHDSWGEVELDSIYKTREKAEIAMKQIYEKEIEMVIEKWPVIN